MDHVTYLGPGDIASDHPFAHPDYIASDVNSLRYMVDQLCLFLELPHLYTHLPRPIIVHRPSADRWTYRVIVTQIEPLLAPTELTFVGFLGQRRSDANLALGDEFDEILVGEIPEHTGLLSYSTMALDGGNYANLVIFTSEAVRDHWSTSQAHAQAVQQLSPNYYLTVTIYNGRLPEGIHQHHDLTLLRAKYYDYQCSPRWQAVRELTTTD